MAIDYTALLGLAAGIQVAKADYDFARDGGAVGVVPINTPVIPSGSLIIGKAAWTTIALTFAGSGALGFFVQGESVVEADPALNVVESAFYNAQAFLLTAADRPITAAISGAAVLTGAVTIWVFYLPT